MGAPVVIVGSGIGGSILARALNARGLDVLLVERARHPRFSLGESSTPLASIGLERLAEEYGLADLLALASYGRWQRDLPRLTHGLKRGFTFYGHVRGEPLEIAAGHENRLLVAASPDDEIADSHWMRAEVDAYLVDRARAEGVAFLDECEVTGMEPTRHGWLVRARRDGRTLDVEAAFVVDASGGASFLPDSTARRAPAASLDTGLVFGHFTGAAPYTEGAAGSVETPYSEESAAIHHLLEEGWMYVLPFDDGRVSAGFVLDRTHPDVPRLLSDPPEAAWRRVLGQYPSLERQFGRAAPVFPVRSVARLQRRAAAAVGPGWARLPAAFSFTSPMFSTGIAWSLLGVERLARALTGDTALRAWRLAAYGWLLELEADHIDRLVEPAYRLRRDFDAFAAWTQVYFAAASFSEAWQRLCDPPSAVGWIDVGFLGATDPAIRGAISRAGRRLAEARAERHPEETEGRGADLERLVGAEIAPRNLAGLADPTRGRLYPVDLDALIRAGGLLSLSEAEVRERLPRLRGLPRAAR